MALTKKDLQQIVKALDPKFKQIDQQFKDVHMEMGNMGNRLNALDRLDVLDKLASKEELKSLEKKVDNMSNRLDGIDSRLDGIDNRLHGIDTRFDDLDISIDDFVDRYEQFAGNMADFQSKVIVRFSHLDAKLEEHDQQFERIIKHVGGHSTLLRNHEQRITKLEIPLTTN